MFLFKNNHVKAALYVLNCTYDIEDESYFSFNSIQHQNKQFQISDYKYLIWKKQVDSNKSKLVFFLIHDSEEDGSKWKLFLQKYQEINEEIKISNFLDIFQLHNIRQNVTLDLQQLESDNQIFSTDFHPYITVIPTKTKIIDINQYIGFLFEF
ncbi:MAG: hypothetical protein HC785_16225 [Calothrix sp. CSU_2_0]|nr:hypothetical protein [Calothrix sp. CSU_2_0]